MSIVEKSSYQPAHFWQKNGHVSTIYKGVVFKSTPPEYQRKRLELPDGDFIDVDFILKSPKKAIILCHGLEGDSRRTYNNTSAALFLENDFSVFAWNNRSCSGEMNRLPQLYHHGSIQDLDFVVKEVLSWGFDEVYLLGFSLGGAQIMNYLGGKTIDSRIIAGVSVSTPISLKETAERLKKGFNQMYLKRFIRKIKKKIDIKKELFPDAIDWSKLEHIRTFDEIDEYLTAPLHGFEDKEDYYHRASPGFVMDKIQTPLLLLNAMDDPFLGEKSFPIEFAQTHEFVHLETPKHGGHCAFPSKNKSCAYSEIRALSFFEEI